MTDHRTKNRADKARQDAAALLECFNETTETLAARLETLICHEMDSAGFEPEKRTKREGLAHLLLELIREGYETPQDPDDAYGDALLDYDDRDD